MRHLLEPNDLTIKETEDIIHLAMNIIDNPEKYKDCCKGKKLATLFYEPSTRTRLSFTAAMMELGGQVLGFDNPTSSSVAKGETIADTVRVMSCFSDIIAMRHPKEGAPLIAKRFSGVPVINAGDGGHNHPTQTLTDMLTIRRELGRFNNLNIGLCGDLKYGRTAHSLIKAMSRYPNNHFVLISPKELELPDYMLELMKSSGVTYEYKDSLEEAIPDLNILYMTRVQQERLESKDEYKRLKLNYILDKKTMELAPYSLVVLHPLPRVGEIAEEVDDDPRAAYFRQVENGKYVRMALIYTLLKWKEEEKNEKDERFTYKDDKLICSNAHCITCAESMESEYYIDERGDKRCVYCDQKVKEKGGLWW